MHIQVEMASCQNVLDQIPRISQGYYSYNIEWTIVSGLLGTAVVYPVLCTSTATIAMTSIWYIDITIVKYLHISRK